MIVYIIMCMILAFVVGVAAGIHYMYDKYNQQMIQYAKEVEAIRLGQARNEGMLAALNIVVGPVKEESE